MSPPAIFYYISRTLRQGAAVLRGNVKSIIDLNQLYNSFVDKALNYNTNDYLPFIKDDIIFQKELKKFKDKGVAIRSYIAYNPHNPLLESIIKESEEWNTLNRNIERAAISISDNKLLRLLRNYRSQLNEYGLYQLRIKITIDENPVANYASRQIGNLNQCMDEINIENARANLINHLNELISEYAEESVQTTKVDAI